MKCTKLRNKFLKDVSLLKKAKREYFGNLNEKKLCDNKTFWKTLKPFLSDKIVS